jgi:hypothetical protein
MLTERHSLRRSAASSKPELNEIGSCAIPGRVDAKTCQEGVIAVERLALGLRLSAQSVNRAFRKPFFHDACVHEFDLDAL